MSSQPKKRFGLPWGAERASDASAAGAATLDPASSDPSVDSDDLGEGSFNLAGASPTPFTEEAPASSDVPDEPAEAAMIDTQAQTQTTKDSDADAGAEAGDVAGTAAGAGGAWPDADHRTSPNHAQDAERGAALPPIQATGAKPARRDNPLVAGLVKAMREAAVSSREETVSRLHADAEARVEGIRNRATTESAELRKRAEGDIAEIREWSKAEIARIREETEGRIEARKTELSGEIDRHAESVERLVSDVKSVVERYQDDMERFFQRLLAEEDPARLAALAEQAPEAPDLSGDGPAAIDMAETMDADAVAARLATPDGLEADAAAAAEVAAGEGLDLGQSNEWPAAVLAAASRGSDGRADGPKDGEETTRLLVTGLGSVAGISSLKGALGQLPGVHNVSVSSGSRGEFVFALAHEPGIDLATGVESLPGFGARITDATDEGISVVAHEPAA
jgi:hypothetical protein